VNPVNSFIVSILTWGIGFVIKKTKIPNDMIPQILYYVSIVTSYLIAVLQNLVTGTAHAGSLAVIPDSTLVTGPAGAHPVVVPDPLLNGSIGWIITNIWDWIGRKLIWGVIFKKAQA